MRIFTNRLHIPNKLMVMEMVCFLTTDFRCCKLEYPYFWISLYDA